MIAILKRCWWLLCWPWSLLRRWHALNVLLKERVALAATYQRGDDDYEPGEWYDPIEDDPQLRPLIDEAEEQADAECAVAGDGTGRCHRVWAAQKRILKRRHGIDWFTPSEMNPQIFYD